MRLSTRTLLVTLLFCSAALLIGRDHPLQNLNEGLYARVAQEMLERRDFIVPTLDGVPYLEKPPLLYWITAAAYATFGVSEAAARLGPLAGALVTLAAAAWFAWRHLGRQVTYFAVAILASTPIVLVLARTLLFDLLFTGLLFASLVMLYEALARPDEARWLRWSYGLLACAILAKGLAALVFYGLVVIAVLLPMGRDAGIAAARRLGDPVAIAILLALAVPWHVLAASAQPGFTWFYFVNEHLLRFFDARVPHDYHTGAWWYFLPRIPLDIFPWALLLLLPGRRTPLAPQVRSARRFLWVAFLVPLVVYSLSRAKGEYYLAVGAPPLALLAADRLTRALPAARRAVLVVLAATLLAVVVGLAWIVPARIAPYAMPDSRTPLLVLAAAFAAVGLGAALRCRPRLAVLACAAVSIPWIAFYSDFLRTNEPLKSARTLARQLDGTSEPVYLYGEFESLSAFPFYLDAPVGVVDSRSADLWYGAKLEPHPARFPDAAGLQRRATVEPLWLVVPKAARADFARSGLASAFVEERTVGTNDLYASRPLAEQLTRERAPESVANAAPDGGIDATPRRREHGS